MSEVQKWADKAMYEAAPVEGLSVHLISATPEPLGSIAAAASIYEGGVVRDKAEIPANQRLFYWDQVQKTHLQAPLEFVDFHFLLEGVTRAFTHQLVRQRTAVYAQESLRFAVKSDLVHESAQPPSISEGSAEQAVWLSALETIEDAYESLIDRGVPAEDARGLLPHAVRTRVHYKTNLRGLAEHAGNRLCTQAQYEWRIVLSLMVHAIRGQGNSPEEREEFRTIANSELFRPVCFKMGRCPFNASFDRGCTIRERVEAGRFNDIRNHEWLADPTAARRKYDD